MYWRDVWQELGGDGPGDDSEPKLGLGSYEFAEPPWLGQHLTITSWTSLTSNTSGNGSKTGMT